MHIVMAYRVVACRVMAYRVMAYIVVAYRSTKFDYGQKVTTGMRIKLWSV